MKDRKGIKVVWYYDTVLDWRFFIAFILQGMNGAFIVAYGYGLACSMSPVYIAISSFLTISSLCLLLFVKYPERKVLRHRSG